MNHESILLDSHFIERMDNGSPCTKLHTYLWSWSSLTDKFGTALEVWGEGQRWTNPFSISFIRWLRRVTCFSSYGLLELLFPPVGLCDGVKKLKGERNIKCISPTILSLSWGKPVLWFYEQIQTKITFYTCILRGLKELEARVDNNMRGGGLSFL